MSVGKIHDVKGKAGYSQLMYVDNDGSCKSLLLTAREVSVGLDRANKNLKILLVPTFLDRFFSFLLRIFGR